MRIKNSFFLVLFLVGKSIFSQASRIDSSINRPLKWDVSLNVLDVRKITKGSTIPQWNLTLLFRNNYRDNRAFRFSPSFYIDKTYNIQNNKSAIWYDNKEIGGRIGHEWQRTTGRIQFFYGLEAAYTYGFWRNFQIPKELQQEKDAFPYKQHTSSLGLFVGAKYYILSNLSLSAESHLFFQNKSRVTYTYDKSSTYYRDNDRILRLVPLRYLNVSFHF